MCDRYLDIDIDRHTHEHNLSHGQISLVLLHFSRFTRFLVLIPPTLGFRTHTTRFLSLSFCMFSLLRLFLCFSLPLAQNHNPLPAHTPFESRAEAFAPASKTGTQSQLKA